ASCCIIKATFEQAGPLRRSRATWDKTGYKAIVHPSRCALRALLRMTYFLMALRKNVILRRPPTGPRFARPEDKLRGRLEGRRMLIQGTSEFMQRSRERGGQSVDAGLP